MTVRQRGSFMWPGGVAKAEDIIFFSAFSAFHVGSQNLWYVLIRRASNLRVSSPTATMSGTLFLIIGQK